MTPAPASDKQSVCVIGAGPSGLAMLRALASKAAASIASGDSSNPVRDALGVEVVCFEKQEDWGGLWRYDWRAGTDSHGEPVHNSMYRHLWSNGPKEALEFADYPFDTHFNRPIPSYPPREVLYDYIEGRVNRADVRRYCRFSTPVQWVRYDDATGKFIVTVCDYTPDANRAAVDDPNTAAAAPITADESSEELGTRVYTMVFDRVVVACGHFSTPHVPTFAGMDEFKGRVLHAHDFREAAEFKDLHVLCIGASYSSEDIASQCFKYGAKKVTMTYRTAALGMDWPEGMEELPLLQSITPDGLATFKDGSERNIDAVILCTGYRHYFPFLEPTLRLKTHNQVIVNELYKGVVWPENQKLYYIGMQDQWFTFNMFDVEAWYVRDLILSDNAALAGISVDTMRADTQKWLDRQEKEPSPKQSIFLQADYIKSLLPTLKDYPLTAEQVDGMSKCFVEWKGHKKAKNGIMTFRDERFKSVFTGTMAAQHNATWLKAFDDSLEGYLKGSE